MPKHRQRRTPSRTPQDPPALARLRQRDFAGAEQAARQALRRQPGDRTARLHLAEALSGQGRLGEALATYRSLYAQSPADRHLPLQIALLSSKLGRFAEARAALDAALSQHPFDPYLLYNRVILEPWTAQHPCFAQVRQALDTAVDPRQRAAAHFALAKLHENGGDYRQAFADYRAANACIFELARQSPHFALRHHPAGQDTDATLQRYHAAFFAARRDWGETVARPPVLVLGPSRSGKSLLANLLDAHPALTNLDERRDLGEAFMRYGAAMLAPPSAAGREAAAGFARRYAGTLAAAAGTGRQGIDTQPLNLPLIGLLALAVPNARVILIERDAQDLLLANYCCHHQSPGYAYSSNLADCQAFLHNYARLARHWRALAPLPIHTVHYEDLVAAPDRVISEVLDFLGLDGVEACRANREEDTAFAGLTPGVSLTVRSRITPDLVGYWQHFAEWLPEAIEADRQKVSPQH